MSDQSRAIAELRRAHPQTYTQLWGVELGSGTAAPLFQLLCGALLSSARIRATVATAATRGLHAAGWTTAARLQRSSWERRVEVLHEAGYTRYQERTATLLGEAADQLLERYGGDLRRLRDQAQRDRDGERRLLGEIPGIGATGAAIFLREVQLIWPEVRPFADRRALAAARRRGLPGSAAALEKLAGGEDFVHLVAALVQEDLAE